MSNVNEKDFGKLFEISKIARLDSIGHLPDGWVSPEVADFFKSFPCKELVRMMFILSDAEEFLSALTDEQRRAFDAVTLTDEQKAELEVLA